MLMDEGWCIVWRTAHTVRTDDEHNTTHTVRTQDEHVTEQSDTPHPIKRTDRTQTK
jgi:hypothetical protein